MNYSLFSVPKHNMTLALWSNQNFNIIGLNYLNEIITEVDDFVMPPMDVRPNVMLTKYVKEQIESHPEWGNGSLSSNHGDLEWLLDVICYYIKIYQEKHIKRFRIPVPQVEIVRDALEHYREHLQMTKGDDDSIEKQYLEFDLITLEGIFSADYGIDVVIDMDSISAFSAKHGVDFPEYITITNQ